MIIVAAPANDTPPPSPPFPPPTPLCITLQCMSHLKFIDIFLSLHLCSIYHIHSCPNDSLCGHIRHECSFESEGQKKHTGFAGRWYVAFLQQLLDGWMCYTACFRILPWGLDGREQIWFLLCFRISTSSATQPVWKRFWAWRVNSRFFPKHPELTAPTPTLLRRTFFHGCLCSLRT